MKKLAKLFSLAAFAAGVAWMLRDQLMPGPSAPTDHPPAFRNPPPAPKPKPTTSPTDAARTTPSGGSDDLTAVNGVGPAYARKLAAAGVTTFGQLAAADADELAARANLPRDRVADWIGKAADLA